MSAQDILAELPRLSDAERDLVAKALRALRADNQPAASQARRADLHAGAWQVGADFDAPLPETFWLGEDA